MANKDKAADKGHDASNVPRLSPREIFEDLLGEPSERGYEEETLEDIYARSRYFACDPRHSWREIEGKEQAPAGKNKDGEDPP